MPGSIFEWEGIEYEHNPKSADWYWAVGIVATALGLAAIIFTNYLLAVLVAVAAGSLALHAAKKPQTHHFTLTEQGLVIGTQLYPFQHMESFSMFEYIEGDAGSVLSIKMESWFTPHLLIPLAGVDADEVYAYFLDHVDEKVHENTFADLVAAWLGF